MKSLNYISLIILLLWFLPGFCSQQIDPQKIGVRRSIEGGIAEEDFSVGKHWSMPLFHSWYQLDGTLRYLNFSGRTGSAIDVRTTNNNIIHMDISIPFRIKRGEGWKLVQAGLMNDYVERVRTTAMSILPQELSGLSTEEVQLPDKRIAAAASTLPALNKAIAPYHVEATHIVIRAFRFRKQLQNKQQFIVDGKLDEARKSESVAKQKTETIEKRIGKRVALKKEEWNKKIETLKSKYELQIARIKARANIYTKKQKSEANARYAEFEAEGKLAMAKAEALGVRLRSEALATKADRTFSAIEAVRGFKLGDSIQLNSYNPRFLRDFASMDAWRKFFLPSE